jgi:hypothetical protein
VTHEQVGHAMSSLGQWGRSLSAGSRLLLGAVFAVYVLGVGAVGWKLVAPERADVPLPPSRWVQAPMELDELFGVQVNTGVGDLNSSRSYMAYDVGEQGQLLVETWYVGQPVLETVPRRGRPGLTDQQRHERDVAFARGDDAYEAWRQEMGLDDPPPPPLRRGPVFADLEIDCVRVIVSGTDVPDPDPAALDALATMIEQRVTWWLDDPQTGEPCRQLWWYGDA